MSRLVAFLSEKSSQAASRAAATLAASIEDLRQFPNSGRKGPADNIRELIIRFGAGAYIVQYRVDPDVILVTRVFHSRENR